MKFYFAAILSLAAFSGIAVGAASAQTTSTTQTTTTPTYHDTDCGSWNGDTWEPNGMCGDPTLHRHQRVVGTITYVKGHLVTVQQADQSLVIDDTLALNNQLTGKVAVGR